MSSDRHESEVRREDISLTTQDGHPALQIGRAKVMLRVEFEGAPPESTEQDWYDEWPFFVCDFDEEYFNGLLEITPEVVDAEEADDVE